MEKKGIELNKSFFQSGNPTLLFSNIQFSKDADQTFHNFRASILREKAVLNVFQNPRSTDFEACLAEVYVGKKRELDFRAGRITYSIPSLSA